VQGHQAAQPFPDGHHYPHNIVKIIHDKDRRRSLQLNTLDVQMNDLLTPIIQLFGLLPDAQLFMKDPFGVASIDPQYREHRQTLDHTRAELQARLVHQTRI
jgi:hypothetical protein